MALNEPWANDDEPWRGEMLTMKERVGSPSMVDGQVGQTVLDFIAEKHVVTLEMIVEQFPWIRWGDLFSLLGGFRREGVVTVHQVDAILEIRIKTQRCAVV